MRAGELPYLVTLKSPSQNVVSGDATVVWTTQDTAWMQMEGIGGTFIGLTMAADYRFTGRYRADITPRWRLELGSRVFAIVRPPQDPDGKRIQIVIFANEILA
jgi:head-tail adaptor